MLREIRSSIYPLCRKKEKNKIIAYQVQKCFWFFFHIYYLEQSFFDLFSHSSFYFNLILTISITPIPHCQYFKKLIKTNVLFNPFEDLILRD